VLLVGSVLGLGMLGLTLLPRETRELGQGDLEDAAKASERVEPARGALVDVT
jgi:hypothetical protein